MKKFKVASLFSGCGGLDLGFTGGFSFRDKEFTKHNTEIVFANDFDKDAVAIYQKNKQYFSDHSITFSDIRHLTPESLPTFDILLAGFPCQPFSNAGSRKGTQEEDGRGTLFEECEKVITNSIKKGHIPKAFVLENVRGILSSKMPDGQTSVPDEIIRRMTNLGYNTTYKLLKSSDYGVPQNRYRVIIIGIYKGEKFNFDELDNVVKKYNIPSRKQGTEYELLLGSILSDIPENASQKDDHWPYSPGTMFMVENIAKCDFSKSLLKQFKNTIPLAEMQETVTQGQSWKSIASEKLPPRFKKIRDNPKKYRSPNFYRRFALGEINGTITASAQPENCGITHPLKNRRFTVREIARIQSFPDNFNFKSNHISSSYKVIGNAVPPIMAWVLAKALLNHITKQGK